MSDGRLLPLFALGAACLLAIAGTAALGLGVAVQTAAVAVLFAAYAVAARLTGRGAGPAARPDADAVRPLPMGPGRTLLHRMPAPLLVISEQERVTYANPAAAAILPGARPGVHFSAAIRAPAFVEAIATILQNHADVSFTFSQVRGRERFFEARASYLPASAAGDFGAGAQVIVQIEDRTRDKALLQTRSDFVANASHELRTPLASILGYIETLQGHARDDPEARELFLGIMMTQASRMKRLVDDLMSLSRIEMNAHVRPEARIDLYATASDSAAALYPLASRNDVLLQIELPQDGAGAEVFGDHDQLAQVMVNLIDNAIKYGGSGKKVRVAAAEPDTRYPGCLGVSVIDEGPGIAREHIPRLTERFFRVNPSQSKDMGGTGLGLAITKHILARHQGAVDIRSRVGEGSRFTLWIPRAPEAADDAADGEEPHDVQ
ncbi:sensor histidine kinase [Halovulum marinum]|uniref:sensor histidine kinase n=1 Tax=Halovulum marinum TaxID=2662447 RepID=UPI002D78BF0C|nr:ATP-binding protein [Halovulum marinum]